MASSTNLQQMHRFKTADLVIPLERYTSGVRCFKFGFFRMRFETKGKIIKEITRSNKR